MKGYTVKKIKWLHKSSKKSTLGQFTPFLLGSNSLTFTNLCVMGILSLPLGHTSHYISKFQ